MTCKNINFNAPTFKFAITDEVQVATENSGVSASLFMPTLADPDSTGYDVRCAAPEGVTIHPGEYFKIPLGFRMFAPYGWWLFLAPRSSLFYKKNINSLYGIIDETYENELAFVGQYLPNCDKLIPANSSIVIAFGERIAQVVPVERPRVNMRLITNKELDQAFLERNTSRGTGGFGSTGK